MIYGMAGASDEAGCGVGTVWYHTPVRLPLSDRAGGAKRQIWRDRQIQAQAYNWGVAEALKAHYRGEGILSPRNHSTPLTQLRHETGSAHSLLLQRGGHWSATDAVVVGEALQQRCRQTRVGSRSGAHCPVPGRAQFRDQRSVEARVGCSLAAHVLEEVIA